MNRPKFFDAFHRCIKAILDAGNDVILDHIIESQDWYRELKLLLKGHDVFFVGVHCPIEVLRRREQQLIDRSVGNRFLGEAEYHLKHVHTYSAYDFELDTNEQPNEDAAKALLFAWQRRGDSVFFGVN